MEINESLKTLPESTVNEILLWLSKASVKDVNLMERLAMLTPEARGFIIWAILHTELGGIMVIEPKYLSTLRRQLSTLASEVQPLYSTVRNDLIPGSIRGRYRA